MKKMEHARNSLSVALYMIQNNLRTDYIPGGEIGIPYIISSIILGIMEEFCNPNITPRSMIEDGVELINSVNTEAKYPMLIVSACIDHFNREGFQFTDEQIKNDIERRTQMERKLFTTRGDNMTPEEKQVFLLNKRLGLGEFAIGGTRAIRVYDEEQYELERQQRFEMGYTEETDKGQEAGYDHAQMGEDDF